MRVPSLKGLVSTQLRRRRAVREAREAERRDHRRLVGFYRTLLSPGDLVFDVGANVGSRTAALREVGAIVVAVEPQAQCLTQLRRRFDGDSAVHIVDRALAASPGTYELHLNRIDVVASMSPAWIDAVDKSGRFGEHSEWTGVQEVDALTLDDLIERFGVPRFCKIDVEGFEPEVIAGLSQPLPLVAFEFASEGIAGTVGCVEALERLGMREFAVSPGETLTFSIDWTSASEVRERLLAMRGDEWGDVYARS